MTIRPSSALFAWSALPKLLERGDNGFGVSAGHQPIRRRILRIGEAYQANPEGWPTVAGFPLAVVIVDLDRRRALAGIDAAGLHQMYWEQSGNRLVVGTRLAPC